MDQQHKELKEEVGRGANKVSGQMELSAQPSSLKLFGAGFVLSGCSPSFYYYAARRHVQTAVLFFIFFGLLLAGVETGRVVYKMQPARNTVNTAFNEGKFPAITIANGEAAVHGPEPFVVVDDGRTLVVFDTTGHDNGEVRKKDHPSIFVFDSTGHYTGEELANGRYQSGVILTKTKLVNINDQGQVQIMPLNLPFLRQQTIEINARWVQRVLSGAQVAVFLGLAFWHVILRFVYVALLALVVWVVAAQVKPGVGFVPVLTTGVLAVVPATYAHYLLDRVEMDFFGLFTLLLLLGWGVSLAAAVGERQVGDFLRGQRPLRAWRALIGIPMMAVLVLDAIYKWSNGAAIVWLTAVITYLVLFALELLAAQVAAPGMKSGEIVLQE